MNKPLRLDFASLHAAYQSGETTPIALLEQVCDAAANAPAGVWISLVPREAVLARARELQDLDAATLPLYGLPFAVKDNIDVAGIETTAACHEFAYLPEKSATIVQLLQEAGAVVIGKTNLDQFATGLNGTRSPYGVCHNALLPEYVSGGSSSGSSVTVALGIVSFSLGTDTAGSGRVPAALNNIVGLKPTRGVWSMSGVVPACRTQDTVSAFTLTARDAQTVFEVAAQVDASDPFSRVSQRNGSDFSALPSWKLGVPDAKSLEFFGDGEYERLFGESVEAARELGAEIVEVEFAPFLEAAKLLYEGPWVAERFRATKPLLETQPEAMLPVTRQIIERGGKVTAVETFAAIEKLAGLKKRCDLVWQQVDSIITPTIPTGYTVEQMLDNPIQLNSNLGFYTNFMNLLDYSAIALPAGFRGDGLPFGVTFFAPAHFDEPLLHLGGRWQETHSELKLGATPYHLPNAESKARPAWKGAIPVAVCGAHMSGLPLNVQLAERGARLLQKTRSAPIYRLYALPGGPPQRPGMVRVSEGGAPIELEVWSVPIEAYGSFVAGIPSPLGIGTVELEDGSKVQGFVCEAVAAEGAEDITEFGGWRSWLAAKNS
ncbi:allophanate hydrolase [Abditibacteriota bacterium]|nr:allophanate hydrolase [Abditibacteriota bacterium]